MKLLRYLSTFWRRRRREASIPPPPFKAGKKVEKIKYEVWHGRLSPQEARLKILSLGFTENQTDEKISNAARSENAAN